MSFNPNIIKDKNYGLKDHLYLKFNLRFIYNYKSQDAVNEPLSRLLHGMIKGDGLVYSPYSDNSFYELYIDDILDLLKVWNKLKLNTQDEKLLGKNPQTKYQILYNRIENI